MSALTEAAVRRGRSSCGFEMSLAVVSRLYCTFNSELAHQVVLLVSQYGSVDVPRALKRFGNKEKDKTVQKER